MRIAIRGAPSAPERGILERARARGIARDVGTTMLRGLAQLAFADSARAGSFLLSAIALVSLPGAVGAVLGVAVGTVAGRILPGFSSVIARAIILSNARRVALRNASIGAPS